MIALEVEDKELIERLLNRGIDSGRSDDQNEDIIKKTELMSTMLKPHLLKNITYRKINYIRLMDLVVLRIFLKR